MNIEPFKTQLNSLLTVLMKKPKKVTIVVLSMCFLSLYFEVPKGLFSHFHDDALYKENLAYIEKTEERLLVSMVELSATKGVLDAIASADIGFDFLVEIKLDIGREVDALKSSVDTAISNTEVLMISLAILGMINLIASVSAVVLLKLVIALGIFYLLTRLTPISRLKKFSNYCLKLVFLVFISVQLIIPYTLHASSYFSYHLFTHHSKQHWLNLRHLHLEFSDIKPVTSPKAHAQSLIKKMESFSVNHDKLISSFHSNWYQYYIAEIFIIILFPLTTLVFGFWGYLKIIRSLDHINKASKQTIYPSTN